MVTQRLWNFGCYFWAGIVRTVGVMYASFEWNDEAAASRKLNLGHRLSDDVSNDPMLESKHRIFLSHSRFQKEFVEHLCIALESRCRYSFFDIRPSSLPKGERFPKLILEAIEQCELLVVVLSDEYFMSKWPMIELHGFVQAIEAMKHKPSTSRQKLILPLFYKLSVKEFRDETRRKKWFKKWEILAKDDGQRRINVSAWKNALDMLGSYNGISYNEELQGIKAYEDDIVSHICDKITADVKWDDSHVQGKAQIFEIIRRSIRSVGRSERYGCKVVGIFGVGGSGKTTICKTLCNELSNEYEGRVCHVELEMQTTASSSVESFRKVVMLLTNKDAEFLRELNDGQCRDILRRSVRRRRTFLVVDNVWDNHESRMQAKTILEASKFHKESLVIVTARSRSMLERLGIRGDACVEMPGLGEADAVKLFLYHAADGKQFAGKERWDIVRCIKPCYFPKGGRTGSHYHPLALQALGRLLRDEGEKPSEWLEKLPRVRNFIDMGGGNPVFDILRSSFDLLRPSEQNLFMDLVIYRPFDVANCQFGSRWAEMMEWLCLVYGEGEVEMRSRLDLLKRKGLLQDVDLTSGRMSMHDLYMEFAVLEGEGKLDESADFEHRRCVTIWNSDVTELERRPSGGCWQKLSRLGIVEGEQDQRPKNPIRSLEGIEGQFLSNVVVLKLEGLRSLRGRLNLEGLKCLRSLVFCGVDRLDVVEGLEGLRNLIYFKWYNWTSGRGFGTSISGQLPASLQVLVMEVYVWLEPNVLVRCGKLCKLELSEIRAEELDLSCCSSLQSVKIKSVVKLQTLSLPLTARGACRLKSLMIWLCRDLADIRGLDQLIGLERLELWHCPSFKELPDLQNLTKLQVLRLPNQRYLERKVGVKVAGCCFPRQLREFFYWCPKANEAPNVSGFEQLEVLELCLDKGADGEATNLGGLEDLPALRRLGLGGCRIWSGWPDLRKSTKLERLILKDCEVELQEEDIGMLVSLPLLQPVLFDGGVCFVILDLVRRKVQRKRTVGLLDKSCQPERHDDWLMSDLGMPPIRLKANEAYAKEEGTGTIFRRSVPAKRK